MSDYVRRRDKLVKFAERFADRSIADKRHMRNGEDKAARWNRLFHAEMNRLAKDRGL